MGQRGPQPRDRDAELSEAYAAVEEWRRHGATELRQRAWSASERARLRDVLGTSEEAVDEVESL